MKTFRNYMAEDYQDLSEKLITFANQAYPKFGQVLIMAGGAGSGKGFVLSNLIGMDGIKFDVDALKTAASKAPLIKKRVKDELGIDIQKLSGDLKNPENVSTLHSIIGEFLHLDDRKQQATFQSIMTAAPDRKPNLIFDVTLSTLRKLETLCENARLLGYDKKNIHIVWVVNDVEVAKVQNAKRDRVVPAEILVSTHRGASSTMKEILAMGQQITKYMDGDLVFAFNKVGVDAEFVKGTNKKAGYVKTANYFYVKRSGHTMMSMDQIDKDIKAKIAAYVPKDLVWA